MTDDHTCSAKACTGELCPVKCPGGLQPCNNQPLPPGYVHTVTNDALNPTSRGLRTTKAIAAGDIITAFSSAIIYTPEMTVELDELAKAMKLSGMHTQYSAREYFRDADEVRIAGVRLSVVWAIPPQDVHIWKRQGASPELLRAMETTGPFTGMGEFANHSCCSILGCATACNSELVLRYRITEECTQVGLFLLATRPIAAGNRILTHYGDISTWQFQCHCCTCRSVHAPSNTQGETATARHESACWTQGVFREPTHGPRDTMTNMNKKHRYWSRRWKSQGDWAISKEQLQTLATGNVCTTVVDMILNWSVHGHTKGLHLTPVGGGDVLVVPSTTWSHLTQALSSIHSIHQFWSLATNGNVICSMGAHAHNLRLVLFPILRSKHWILEAFFPQRKRKLHLDSLPSYTGEVGSLEVRAVTWIWWQLIWYSSSQGKHPQPVWTFDSKAQALEALAATGLKVDTQIDVVNSWLHQLGLATSDDVLTGSNWSSVTVEETPKQRDGVSCDMFVITSVIGLSRGWLDGDEDAYLGPLEDTGSTPWADHMRSWVFRTVWDNTTMEIPAFCLQCGMELQDSGAGDRCTDTEGCNKRKSELGSLGHADHAPICIGTETEVTPEVAVSAEVCSVTATTWETFDNTCYIQAVTESLQQLEHFMTWCSNNSATYIHDLVDVHSANFPDTLNKYIMWLRQSGLQRRVRTGWLPGDALVFCAQLCDLLHRSSAQSLQRLFAIEITYHTVCQGCKLSCDRKVSMPYILVPFWLDEVSTTLQRWFSQSLTVQWCDMCGFYSLHQEDQWVSSSPPHLVIGVQRRSLATQHIRHDRAQNGEGDPYGDAHKRFPAPLFSRFGLGCYYPPKFPYTWVSQNERRSWKPGTPPPAAADQALLSAFPTEHEHLGLRNLGLREWHLQANMTWECSIKVLADMPSSRIKCAWCKDWSHSIVCHRCGWLKDSACWYSHWGKGHRGLHQCARCLRWLPSFTWGCHSNDAAAQLLDTMRQTTDPSHLEYDALPHDALENVVRSRIVLWLDSLTKHPRHIPRLMPPSCVVGQQISIPGFPSQRYDVSAVVAHRSQKEDTRGQWGHFWSVSQNRPTPSQPATGIHDDTYLVFGTKSPARQLADATPVPRQVPK